MQPGLLHQPRSVPDGLRGCLQLPEDCTQFYKFPSRHCFSCISQISTRCVFLTIIWLGIPSHFLSDCLCSPTGYLEQRRQNVTLLSNRLLSAQIQCVDRKKHRFVEQTSKLDAMSPLKVLTRGYSMTQTQDGTVLRSVKQVDIADNIAIRLGDGSVSAMVTDIKEKV